MIFTRVIHKEPEIFSVDFVLLVILYEFLSSKQTQKVNCINRSMIAMFWFLTFFENPLTVNLSQLPLNVSARMFV